MDQSSFGTNFELSSPFFVANKIANKVYDRESNRDLSHGKRPL